MRAAQQKFYPYREQRTSGLEACRLAALLLVAFTLNAAIWAQVVGGAISGIVRDQTGAALVGANVTIKSAETGAERKLVTDASGMYATASIAVGEYEITASKEGFNSETKTGINLVIGQSRTVDLMLQLGSVRQEITVEEAPSPVNLSTQENSGLVSERQVKDLPLNGRSYDELITLNPAIVNYSSQRSGGVGSSNSAVGNMFAVSGHRPQENLFLLNGIEYTGASEINNTPGGASGQLLGVDAVREFNVVTDTYGAEYGKRPGAQVSIVTASGTNALHGSVYEFLRNSDLDARNFFDQGTIPQFQRNEFGGALGGPIKKNKLFVFGNYEGFRQHLGLSDVTLVPDTAARNGNLPAANGARNAYWLLHRLLRRCYRFGPRRMDPISAAVLEKRLVIHCKPFVKISVLRAWTTTLPKRTRFSRSTRSTIARITRRLSIR